MSFTAATLIDYVTATGALGTAAMGLVDICKSLPGGGVSKAGLPQLRACLAPYNTILNGIPGGAAWKTIKGLWINGETIENQKAKAKALIKLGFSLDPPAAMAPATMATAMAAATGLPADDLALLATAFATGTTLTPQQTDLYGRMDAIISAVLDAGYEQADQRYRNLSKCLAALFAVALALAGRVLLNNAAPATPTTLYDLALAALTGLIATPLAPVTKDVVTAINTAVVNSGKLRALLQ